jgi:hypothetical protein
MENASNVPNTESVKLSWRLALRKKATIWHIDDALALISRSSEAAKTMQLGGSQNRKTATYQMRWQNNWHSRWRFRGDVFRARDSSVLLQRRDL